MPSWQVVVVDSVGKAVRNYRVCMGIQQQITFSKLEFYTICENIKIRGRRLYTPSFKDVAWLKDA